MAGAVLRRHGLSVSPRFVWEWLTSRTVSPFPAPARRVQKHKYVCFFGHNGVR